MITFSVKPNILSLRSRILAIPRAIANTVFDGYQIPAISSPQRCGVGMIVRKVNPKRDLIWSSLTVPH